uniref:Uncharacterized protein n=1 Tax=Oryza glumipatula TaxID=40148 RepID=A0A0E0BJX5_9ORYZ
MAPRASGGRRITRECSWMVVGNGISKINAATPKDAGKRKKKAVEVESRTREVAITVAGVAVRCSRWLGWCSTSPS